MDDTIVFEGMTSVSALINSRLNKISDRVIYKILYDRAVASDKRGQIDFIKRNSGILGYKVETTDGGYIASLSSGKTHGGIIALCGSRQYPTLTSADIVENGLYFYLEGIEDPYNFGDSLRSLYASGVNGIILSERNWLGAAAGTVAKASAGAFELLPTYISSPEIASDLFNEKHYLIVSAGIRNSESLFETDLPLPLLAVIGGEKRGVSRAFLERSQKVIRIDYGNPAFRGSLSASAAAAVLAFEIMRKNKSHNVL